MFICEYRQCYLFYLLIIILNFLKIQAEIEDYSTYKRMDLYKLESSSPEQHCENFVCHKSGLSTVRIMQILDKENEIRNDFANTQRISNLYHVEWSAHFARFARRKAQLCLHQTDESNVIFESRIFQEWYKGKKKENFPKQVALEVVIGQRIKAINNTTVLYRYDELEDELGIFFGQNYFNYANALRRRGSVLQMGCDYVVQNNKTHLTSNLVCVYGVLYFSDGMTNDYLAISGTSCSKCDFYSRRPYIRSRNGSLPWGCLSTFAFLCGDLVVSPDPVDDFRYSCNGTPAKAIVKGVHPPIVDLDTVKIAEKSSHIEATESSPHNWPCLKYAIPILLVTSIMVAIVLYQVYSIISIKLRSN